MTSEIAIECISLSKMYDIPESTDKGYFKSLFTKKKSFTALDDVSFEIKKGECIGIIGKNGAGKSTLLKILSRITYPTKGTIAINGKLTALLEIGTGFHPELTGRENIYLNGSLLGMNKKEIDENLDEIVDFSGVGEFIDMPVKNFSSGMVVRLGFSVAAHLSYDILLLDEIITVGDFSFQEKVINKIETLKTSGKTIIMVSHSLSSIKQFCTKTMLFEKGKLIKFDFTLNTIESYYKLLNKIRDYSFIGNASKDFEIESIWLNNKDIKIDNQLSPFEDIEIKIKFISNFRKEFRVTLSLYFDGIRICTAHDTEFLSINSNRFISTFLIEKKTLKPGMWVLAIGGHSRDSIYWFWNNAVETFDILEQYSPEFEKINIGVINLPIKSNRVEL